MKPIRCLFYAFFILFVLHPRTSIAQQSRHKEIFVGFGYYDAICVGFSKNLTQSFTTGVSIGTNFRMYNNQEYYHANIFLDWEIPKKASKDSVSNWILSANLYNVYIEDAFYKWDFLAIVPSIGRYFSFNKSSGFRIDAGPAFNIVLYNKRKTYENVGWPYHVLANVRLVFFLQFQK